MSPSAMPAGSGGPRQVVESSKQEVSSPPSPSPAGNQQGSDCAVCMARSGPRLAATDPPAVGFLTLSESASHLWSPAPLKQRWMGLLGGTFAVLLCFGARALFLPF